MIGNAVPSLLAEVLANEIRNQFFCESRRRKRLSLLPARQENTPRPERVGALDPSYQHLLGDHPEHAGEGRGPGALLRNGA